MQTPASPMAWSVRAHHHGFSLVELLMTISVLAILGTIAVHFFGGTKSAADQAKLQSDVRVLNQAVRMYIAEGGNMNNVTTTAEVLSRLKTKSSAQVARRHVGASTGRFVDPRLAVHLTRPSDASSLRAVWSPGQQKFLLQTHGTGVSSFYFDESLAGTATAEEARTRSSMQLNRGDGWIWEWGGQAAPSQVAPPEFAMADPPLASPPSNPSSGTTPSPTPPPPPGDAFVPAPEPLPTPTILPVGGLFSLLQFPSSISISPNGAGAGSQLQYRLDSGAWQPYSSSFAVLPGTQVYARNFSLDTTRFITSAEDMEAYYRLISLITLVVIPEWANMTGKENLVRTIDNHNVNHIKSDYGEPADTNEKANGLEFKRTKSISVPPDADFLMGEISYLNGTVASGTEATAVDLKLEVQILAPILASGDASAHLTLWSSPNTGDEAESADYAQLENPVTDFTVKVDGVTYALELRFANVRPQEGWTDGTKLYVFENSKGRADLIGRFRSR